MPKNEISRNLIGRCGLYCGACDIHRAYIDKDQEKQKRMAKYFKCKPSQICCHGCQNLDQKSWSTDCKILENDVSSLHNFLGSANNRHRARVKELMHLLKN